jgi:transposase
VVLTTVQIWRPAGFSVVRNTNGREGSTPVYNQVRGPDPANMMEFGMDSKRVIGIDIGKHWLDVAFEGVAAVKRRANNAHSIAALVGSLDPIGDIVVFERCGGYERALETALAEAGVAWAVVHSLRVKAFRQVQGIKAKTDAIDARLLCAFGRDRLNAGQLRLGRAEDVTLDALVARRRQLKAALHAEECRCETAAIAVVQASISRMIVQLQAELAAIESELSAREVADPQLALKEAVMCKRKGVACTTARSLLAALPELGRLDSKEITALGGLAPRIHQSGRLERRRGLAPGRSAVKVILFNPARCAMRWDPPMREFRDRLRARGKPGKVIMVAVMRKLLVQLNAAVRDALRTDPNDFGRPCGSMIH